MTPKTFLFFPLLFWSCLAGYSQQESAVVPFRVRVVLNDPANPSADLFYTDQVGAVSKLEFEHQNLSRPVMTQAVNGSLFFYDKAAIDPEKREKSIAATCKIPAGAKQGAVVFFPSPAGVKPAYRLVFIDDSAKGFPKGEARIITLLPIEAAIEVGEHKLPIHPGQIAILPPVKKVSEYNMAQTNFFYKQGEAWTIFTERQLQYLDGFRRIFIVQTTPGAAQPSVLSILDSTVPQ